MGATSYAEFSALASCKAVQQEPSPFKGLPARLDIDAARAELKALIARHDRDYESAETYADWARGQAEAQRIADLRAAIAKAMGAAA